MAKDRITRRHFITDSLMTATLAGAGTFYGPGSTTPPMRAGASSAYHNDAAVRQQRPGRPPRHPDGYRRSQCQGWRARPHGHLGHSRHRIHPATGTRVAERFITREDCSILIGALHSGVANAITQVANKYGTIYLNSNSSAPSEAAENCNRIKFVWDGNGTNFTKAAVRNAVQAIGKNWLLLTNDYVYGHSTAAATKAQVEAAGGRIIDNMLVPQNTRDFTAYLPG